MSPKAWCVCLVCLVSASTAAANERFALRPVDPWAAESLARGLQHSALMRQLADQLEASDVIAHVETASVMPDGAAGMMRFVVGSGGQRYLRITIRRDLPPVDRVATLGHELQHACEIAASDVQSADDMRRLYLRLGGRHLHGETLDTGEAVLTGQRVRREVLGQR